MCVCSVRGLQKNTSAHTEADWPTGKSGNYPAGPPNAGPLEVKSYLESFFGLRF